MKFLLVTLLALSSFSVFSYGGICQKEMTFSSEVETCRSLRHRLSNQQIIACAEFGSFSSDRIDCLEITARRNIGPRKINYCDRENTFSSDKVECLRSATFIHAVCDKELKWSSEKRICKELARGLTIEKVIACSQFGSFSSDVESCLEIVAYSPVGPRAIDICSQRSFSSDRKECLLEMKRRRGHRGGHGHSGVSISISGQL